MRGERAYSPQILRELLHAVPLISQKSNRFLTASPQGEALGAPAPVRPVAADNASRISMVKQDSFSTGRYLPLGI